MKRAAVGKNALVVYVSPCGSTREMVKAIGERRRAAGWTATLADLNREPGLDGVTPSS